MAVSIAGITGWTGWEGQLSRSARQIEVLPPRPGSNEQVLLLGGWSTSPQTLTTRKAYTGANAQQQALADELLCRQTMDGNRKVVEDPLGRQWNVRVLNALCRQYRLIDSRVVLEVEWTLLVEVEDSPPSNG